MSDNESSNLEKTTRIKYKLTKTGKIALIISIISLSIGILSIIFAFLSIIQGYIMIITSIISHLITLIAMTFLFVDIIKFNKLHNVNESNDSKIILGFILGIIFGFIWGKIL